MKGKLLRPPATGKADAKKPSESFLLTLSLGEEQTKTGAPAEVDHRLLA